jgi:hypothetical protein
MSRHNNCFYSWIEREYIEGFDEGRGHAVCEGISVLWPMERYYNYWCRRGRGRWGVGEENIG